MGDGVEERDDRDRQEVQVGDAPELLVQALREERREVVLARADGVAFVEPDVGIAGGHVPAACSRARLDANAAIDESARPTEGFSGDAIGPGVTRTRTPSAARTASTTKGQSADERGSRYSFVEGFSINRV